MSDLVKHINDLFCAESNSNEGKRSVLYLLSYIVTMYLLGSHETLGGLHCGDDGQGNQSGYRPFEVHDEGVLGRLVHRNEFFLF